MSYPSWHSPTARLERKNLLRSSPLLTPRRPRPVLLLFDRDPSNLATTNAVAARVSQTISGFFPEFVRSTGTFLASTPSRSSGISSRTPELHCSTYKPDVRIVPFRSEGPRPLTPRSAPAPRGFHLLPGSLVFRPVSVKHENLPPEKQTAYRRPRRGSGQPQTPPVPRPTHPFEHLF
jgi:hypothetical protein